MRRVRRGVGLRGGAADSSDMSAAPVSAVAVLHHDLGTEVSERGRGHKDLGKPEAGRAFLVLPEAQVPSRGEAQDGKGEGSSGGGCFFRVALTSTHLLVVCDEVALLQVRLEDVPSDWFLAAEVSGAVTVLVVDEMPADVVEVSARLSDYLADPYNGRFVVPLLLSAPVPVAVGERQNALAGLTVLASQPRTLPDFTKVDSAAGEVRTLRDLHQRGFLPPQLGALTCSGNVDDQGVFHEAFGCDRMVGRGEGRSDVLFGEASQRACPVCGPNWDRPLASFADYSSLRRLVDPVVAPLNAVAWRAVNVEDPWWSANVAYQAVVRVAGSSFNGSYGDPDEVVYAVAGVAALLDSIDTIVGSAGGASGLVGAAEHGILVASDPDAREWVRREVGAVSGALAEEIVTRLSYGAVLDSPGQMAALTQRDPTVPADRLVGCVRSVREGLTAQAGELAGPLMWVVASGAFEPDYPAARLAGWRYGRVSNLGVKAHLMAVPARVAEKLIAHANGSVAAVAPVWAGESLAFAREVLGGVSHPSDYVVGKRMQELRVARNTFDPQSPLGWRKFSEAEERVHP